MPTASFRGESTAEDWTLLDARRFALVDDLASAECRYRGLRPSDADEFRSYVRERFAEAGERILSGHENRCTQETYLRVVIVRMLRDWQRTEWGHWRPSAEAIRLGPVAVELDRCLSRDGRSFESAVAELSSRFGPRASPEALEQIQRCLPERSPRRLVSSDALADRASPASADEALIARERAALAGRLGPLMRQALRRLDAIDRLILLLVFREGLSVRAVARAVGLEHKKVGRRLNRALERLRDAIDKGGVDRHGVLLFLECGLDDEANWLDGIEEPEWDNAPARPSSQGTES